MFHRCLRLTDKLPWIRIKNIPEDEIRQFNKNLVSQLYLIGLAKFVFTPTRFILFSAALNLSISPEVLILSTAVGQFSYLFAFTPGGLGIFETGWFAILVFAGIASEVATTFVIGQRVLTTFLVVFLAVLSQIVYMFRNPRPKIIYNKP